MLKVHAPDLAKRLGFYKLRAKVAVEDLSETLAVVAGWDAPRPADEAGLVAEDPRLPALGWRAIVAAEDAAEFAEEPADAYHARRIALGVPEGGRDFLFGDAFPHEALMDQLHGVDFDKGCYVGQEVVSRMQHRGTARTRIVPAVYEGGFAAEAGVEVTAGEKALGKTGTGAEGRGLADDPPRPGGGRARGGRDDPGRRHPGPPRKAGLDRVSVPGTRCLSRRQNLAKRTAEQSHIERVTSWAGPCAEAMRRTVLLGNFR